MCIRDSLKYRYLDLRNPAVKQNIILRCQVIAALRAAMTAHGFLEITTPILTASSPEGARDYLCLLYTSREKEEGRGAEARAPQGSDDRGAAR